jgi:hypothetical protein
MEIVISIVNFLRKHGLNHCQFKHFLEETEVGFGDVLYCTEATYLSRGNMLRFSNLRAEIEIFRNGKSKLSDEEYILHLALLVSITSLLNELNMKLQGKENFSLMYFQISKLLK